VLKLAALGVILVIITLLTAPFPASAQASSAFPYNLSGSSITSCWYFGIDFGATAGEPVTVQWSQNPTGEGAVSVNFYIAPLPEVQRIWLCDDGPVYMYSNDGAYGVANWTAPATGQYAAIIVNYSQYPLSGMMSLTTPNGTTSATPMGPNMVIRRLLICLYPDCIGP